MKKPFLGMYGAGASQYIDPASKSPEHILPACSNLQSCIKMKFKMNRKAVMKPRMEDAIASFWWLKHLAQRFNEFLKTSRIPQIEPIYKT